MHPCGTIYKVTGKNSTRNSIYSKQIRNKFIPFYSIDTKEFRLDINSAYGYIGYYQNVIEGK